MTNDDLAGRLNHIEGYLKGQDNHFKDIKDALENLKIMDRTVAQHSMRFEAVERENRELAHDIKGCQHAHRLQDDVHSKRIEILETGAHSARGFISAVKVIAGGVLVLLGMAANWIYNRAETNLNMNVEQTHQIANIVREIQRIDKVLGK